MSHGVALAKPGRDPSGLRADVLDTAEYQSMLVELVSHPELKEQLFLFTTAVHATLGSADTLGLVEALPVEAPRIHPKLAEVLRSVLLSTYFCVTANSQVHVELSKLLALCKVAGAGAGDGEPTLPYVIARCHQYACDVRAFLTLWERLFGAHYPPPTGGKSTRQVPPQMYAVDWSADEIVGVVVRQWIAGMNERREQLLPSNTTSRNLHFLWVLQDFMALRGELLVGIATLFDSSAARADAFSSVIRLSSLHAELARRAVFQGALIGHGLLPESVQRRCHEFNEQQCRQSNICCDVDESEGRGALEQCVSGEPIRAANRHPSHGTDPVASSAHFEPMIASQCRFIWVLERTFWLMSCTVSLLFSSCLETPFSPVAAPAVHAVPAPEADSTNVSQQPLLSSSREHPQQQTDVQGAVRNRSFGRKARLFSLIRVPFTGGHSSTAAAAAAGEFALGLHGPAATVPTDCLVLALSMPAVQDSESTLSPVQRCAAPESAAHGVGRSLESPPQHSLSVSPRVGEVSGSRGHGDEIFHVNPMTSPLTGRSPVGQRQRRGRGARAGSPLGVSTDGSPVPHAADKRSRFFSLSSLKLIRLRGKPSRELPAMSPTASHVSSSPVAAARVGVTSPFDPANPSVGGGENTHDDWVASSFCSPVSRQSIARRGVECAGEANAEVQFLMSCGWDQLAQAVSSAVHHPKYRATVLLVQDCTSRPGRRSWRQNRFTLTSVDDPVSERHGIAPWVLCFVLPVSRLAVEPRHRAQQQAHLVQSVAFQALGMGDEGRCSFAHVGATYFVIRSDNAYFSRNGARNYFTLVLEHHTTSTSLSAIAEGIERAEASWAFQALSSIRTCWEMRDLCTEAVRTAAWVQPTLVPHP